MGRKIIRFFAFLILLAGVGVFLYPTATKYLAEYKSRKEIEDFQNQIHQVQQEAQTETVPEEEEQDDGPLLQADGGDGENGSVVEEDTAQEEEAEEADAFSQVSADRLAQLRQRLQAYNEQICQEGQSGLQDPFDYEAASFDLTEYGFSQNMIGTIWVPRMEVELPIYLGANHENMAKGAGLLGQTSMPLGGANTNVVLAGHRGWKGIPMFRNIQSLQLGDKIQITTPWETLVYRVCELKIIYPGDSDEILIQEGRDLVTLLTCHPYTQNYQRYLVVAERSDEAPMTREEDRQEAEVTYVEEPRLVEMIREDGTSEQLEVDPSSIKPSAEEGAEAGAEYSNLQIWMEDYGVWVGFGAVVAVIALLYIIHLCRRK